VTYADALLYLFELADREDPRFKQAAARWHARFVLEANLPIGDSESVLSMLSGVRGARRLILRRQLLGRVETAGLTTVDIGSTSGGEGGYASSPSSRFRGR
jgi:hypothetical protein